MPILLVLVAIVSIQVGASFAKGLFPVLGPTGISSLRLLFAALILGAFVRPWAREWKRQELRAVLFYGLALGIMNLSFYLALARLPLGLAVALEFTGPLGVAIFASRRALDLVWALLAAAGVALILPLREAAAVTDWTGVFFALFAGAAWAAYILIGKRASGLVPAGMVTSLGMAIALAVVLPFGIAMSGAALLRFDHYPAAIAVAVLSSALPYTLEMIALNRMPARSFGILMSLEPAVAALAGVAVLGEHLTPQQWVAILLVMVASTGVSVGGKLAS